MKGQSLVEVLVALGVASAAISVAAFVVTSALSNAQYSKNQNLATQYAQQGMEIVRKIRDASWANFCSFHGQMCLSESSTQPQLLVGPTCEGEGDINASGTHLVRGIEFESAGSSCGPGSSCGSGNGRVTVTVAWTGGPCTPAQPFCHKVVLVSCFADINFVPAP